MALASSSAVQLRYMPEATFGVTPTTGNCVELRMVSESLDYAISKEVSKEINLTRAVSSMVPVEASTSGGFQAEFSYREYDPFLASTLQSTFTEYGTSGVQGSASTVTFATGSLTASVATAGADSWATLQLGQWFIVQGSANNNLRLLRVSTTVAPTTTVITLDAGTPATAESAVAGVKLSTSRLTNGSTQTSFSIERNASDISQFFNYTGQTPSKFDINLASGSLTTASFDFMGKEAVRGAVTQLPGTPVASKNYEVHSGVSGVSCQVWEGGAPITGTFTQSLSLSYDNGLRAQKALCALSAVGVGSGTINITGTLTIYFANGNLFDKFKANTNSSIIFSSIDAAGNGYVFSLPVVNITSWKSVAGGKDQDMLVEVNFTALRDASNATASLRKIMFIDRVGAAS